MNFYSIYGACLGTSVEFPELAPVAGVTPKWTFDTTPRLEPMRDPVELGAEVLYAAVSARLYRHATGHRITVDDTGEFDLSSDGRRFLWQDRADAWPDFVRAHLMGRVLATSIFLDGWLPLHGSAVDFGDGVAAFLAPKGYGKSSLALALVQHGARLVTDDTLPIEPGVADGGPRAWPGVHSMRMRPDAIEALAVPHPGSQTREGKSIMTALRDDQRSHGSSPLVAIYLLNPVTPSGGKPAALRTPLPGTVSALSVVAHVKIGAMLGGAAAPVLLHRAAEVARRVPVYRLDAPRDLARITEMAGAIAAWHGVTAPHAAVPEGR